MVGQAQDGTQVTKGCERSWQCQDSAQGSGNSLEAKLSSAENQFVVIPPVVGSAVFTEGPLQGQLKLKEMGVKKVTLVPFCVNPRRKVKASRLRSVEVLPQERYGFYKPYLGVYENSRSDAFFSKVKTSFNSIKERIVDLRERQETL